MGNERPRPDPDALLTAAQTEELSPARMWWSRVSKPARAETAALLAGPETLPRRQLAYRGTALTEMDMDAVLARRPQPALVDELAHTNAPGSRHLKRYQDVGGTVGGRHSRLHDAEHPTCRKPQRRGWRRRCTWH